MIHSVLSLLQYYIAPRGYIVETSVCSVITELKNKCCLGFFSELSQLLLKAW